MNEPIPDRYYFTSMCHRVTANPKSLLMLSSGFFLKSGVKYDWNRGVYDHFAAVYVLRGKGTYIDHNGKKYEIRPGALFLRGTEKEHTLIIDPASEWAECFLGFKAVRHQQDVMKGFETSSKKQWKPEIFSRPDFTMEFLNALNLFPEGSPVQYPGVKLEMVEKIYQLYQQMKTAGPLQMKEMALTEMNLLQELLNLSESIPKAHSYNTQLVAKVCEILNANLESRETLEEQLKQLGISYSRLRVIFKEEMGMSIGSYQVRARIDRACVMLSQGKAVKQVAAELGYNDPFFFSTQFKKFTGSSPRQFKKSFYL